MSVLEAVEKGGEERRSYGIKLRVRPEVEELVVEVANELGYSRDTVRNVAILLGLILIKSGFEMPKDSKEFVKLLNTTKTIIKLTEELKEEVGVKGVRRYVRRVRK